MGSRYSSVGSEATSAMPSPDDLNKLGIKGWELVGVYLEMETAFPNFALGDTVQGLKSNVRPQDVVLLFKREFDADRTRREAEEDAKELAKRAIAFKKAQEDAAKQPSTSLVDLDNVDFLSATAAQRANEEKRLSDAIAGIPGYKISQTTAESTASTPTDSAVTAVVVLDGTEGLLKDGNKYRKSEATKLAREFADAVYKKAQLKTSEYSSKELDAFTGKVKIHVQVVIQFGGGAQKVAEVTIGGNWR